MMSFLNNSNETITGCLSRQSCLKTAAGYYVKDLRIIKNRDQNDMLLIDNLTLSFGHTI
jgi:TFIIF-interacting CTD phosphatase-like protein